MKNQGILQKPKEYSSKRKLSPKNLAEELNAQYILPYFVEIQKRSNETIMSHEFISNLIENRALYRKVNTQLELPDIRVFEENGMEKKYETKSLSKIKSNIEQIRSSSTFSNENVGNKNNPL